MPDLPGEFGGSGAPLPTYADRFFDLLPRGPLWNPERTSKIRALVAAIADEFDRIATRALNLIEETDPRTAAESLEDWERMLSLPDELVIEIPASMEERRAAITSKYIGRGGQNYAYFEELCAACGYPLLSIFLYSTLVTRSGFLCGSVLYGSQWAYAIGFVLDTPTAGALTEEQFEALIRKKTHSHIIVTFEYT